MLEEQTLTKPNNNMHFNFKNVAELFQISFSKAPLIRTFIFFAMVLLISTPHIDNYLVLFMTD